MQIKKLSGYYLIYLLIFCSCSIVVSQSTDNSALKVYLFPGQGSDYRIFQNLKFDVPIEKIYISYPVPEMGSTMEEYALCFLSQVDTSEPFILIGVSLGGMICTELSHSCNPEKTVIISSADGRSELPARYKFMKYFPVYKIIPASVLKIGAFIAQPIVEPDRRHGKEVFVSMLKTKDPGFIKRTTEMIIQWDRSGPNTNIVHIHGTSDHTLPIRKVKPDYIIQRGSHMMVFTRGSEISSIVNTIITGMEM